MFGVLTEKLQGALSGLVGKKRLSEADITDAVRQVRLALLEADVNYAVTKTLVQRLKKQAVGEELIKSVKPGQQFVKIVHDELAHLMGDSESSLDLSSKLTVILFCGLQGSGKTTHCVKLAKYLKGKDHGKKVMLAACDLQRPAAVEQLKTLASQIDVPVYSVDGEQRPLEVARGAYERAEFEGFDVLIVDTAGRLHIDDELMNQLSSMRHALNPSEVLFVVNATMGQDALKTAAEFNDRIAITGTILTMLDSQARGGAAISVKEVTGKPLKFEGVGEHLDDFQVFNPTSMADRILGMGDTINLVKKAKDIISEGEQKKLEEKLRKATFTYNDYLGHMQSIKKMGPLSKLMEMMPGAGSMKEMMKGVTGSPEKEFKRVEAIIQSMTLEERRERCELIVSRRKRIAIGSGTKMEDVNKLVKSFKQAKKMFKGMPNMKKLEKLMGGTKWP